MNLIWWQNREREVKEAKQQNKKPKKLLPKPKKPSWIENNTRQLPKIKMIGVWDTVGAMGVPKRYRKYFWLIPRHQTFSNTQLCGNVENAYHAMAIDESRIDFCQAPWTYPSGNTDLPKDINVEQKWFVGAHGNIGGGYKNNYLNEIPCNWIQKKAMDLGLVFHREVKASDRSIKEPIIDSYKHFANGFHKIFNDRYLRPITVGDGEHPGGIVRESIHESVWEYAKQNIYRSKNIPAHLIKEYLHDDSDNLENDS